MNFRQLECFIGVCEHLNFTHAAKDLYISQQGLSKTIGVLEKELGVPLFFRTVSTLQLTEYGEFFLPYAKVLLTQYSKTMYEFEHFVQDSPGKLKVGIPYGFINIFPSGIIDAFNARYPNISLNFVQYNDTACDEALINGSIDIGFCVGSLPEDTFNIHKTHSEQTLYMLGEGHPLAGRSQISLKELKDYNFITFGRESKSHDNFLRRCRDFGFEPTIGMATLDMQMIFQMCKNNSGVGFWTGDPNTKIPGIVLIPDSDEEWTWSISIVTKCGKYLSNNMKSFISCFSSW